MSRRLVDGHLPTTDKGGRPPDSSPILTDDLEKRICDILRAGGFVETAAKMTRIGVGTIRNWIINGVQEPASRYGEFLRSIEAAIAEGEMGDVAVLHVGARGKPATYKEEPVIGPDGQPIKLPDGKYLMQLARDADGNPVKLTEEIKADPKVAQWKLSHRHPNKWGDKLRVDIGEPILDAPISEKPKEREALSPEDHEKLKKKAERLLLQSKKFGDIDDA